MLKVPTGCKTPKRGRDEYNLTCTDLRRMMKDAQHITYKQLMSYHHFRTEAEAREYIKARRWRKYVVSSNAEGTCWTVYHKER